MAMEEGEEKSACPTMKRFSAEEDSLPRNEAIVKDDIRVGIARSKTPLEVLPIPQVMYGDHLLHPFPDCGDSKGHSPVLLLWKKRAGGNDQYFVRYKSL